MQDDLDGLEETLDRKSNELAAERTEMAFERSKMASDRTTMGFMRTSISLIGFGFSIPALFEVIRRVPGLEDSPIERARFIGLFMLGLAIFMLLTAIVQHVVYIRKLANLANRTFPYSIALVASVLLLSVAMFALINILLKVQPL
jgi:putative membrane protein